MSFIEVSAWISWRSRFEQTGARKAATVLQQSYVCLVAGHVTSILVQACIYTVYANTCFKNVPHFVMLLRNVLVPLGLGQIEKPLAGGVRSDSLWQRSFSFCTHLYLPNFPKFVFNWDFLFYNRLWCGLIWRLNWKYAFITLGSCADILMLKDEIDGTCHVCGLGEKLHTKF